MGWAAAWKGFFGDRENGYQVAGGSSKCGKW